LKVTIQAQSREPVWIDEKVGEFEATPATYRAKIQQLKELLRRAKLE